jgi:hypothetical protein
LSFCVRRCRHLERLAGLAGGSTSRTTGAGTRANLNHAVLVLALSRDGAFYLRRVRRRAGGSGEAGWYAWSAPGHIHLLDYHLYSALALSRQLTPETFSANYRRSIHYHYDKIALWAR